MRSASRCPDLRSATSRVSCRTKRGPGCLIVAALDASPTSPRMKRLLACLTLAVTACATHAQNLPPVSDRPYPGAITLQVDTSDLDRKIFRTRETLPVRPGPLVLFYPRWLPGTHAPSGNVAELTGLQIQGADGQRIDWKRDTVDVHAFHLDVPARVAPLNLAFQFVSPRDT